MKRNIYGALTMFALAFLLSVPMVQAQSTLSANVPFAFSMGEKAMPAGTYQIRSVSDQVLALENLDSQHSWLVMKSHYVQASESQNPKLVFDKIGDQYFLSQIWDGRSNSGIELSSSKREKELQIAGASVPNDQETVIVAMK